MLASLAARAIPLAASTLPAILTGLTTGLLFGGINKAISRDGLYLHKHDKCYRVQKCEGDGLYLAPHPHFAEGDALFLKRGNDISDGAGLLMGSIVGLLVQKVINVYEDLPVLYDLKGYKVFKERVGKLVVSEVKRRKGHLR